MSENDSQQDSKAADQVQGRSVFVIETVPVGISVRTAFLTQDEKLLEMPAVFPNLQYALAQVEELRQHIFKHFDDAAKVGAQVIASQQAARSNTTSAATDDVAADDDSDEASGSKTGARKTLSKPRPRHN